MRRIAASFSVLALALSAWGCSRIVFYRYQSASCRQRGNAYKQRTEQLERDAQEKLTIGTERDDVIRFFHELIFTIQARRGRTSC